MINIKVGDYVKKGDAIVTFYYKDDEDLEKYKQDIMGCVRITDTHIKPIDIVEKVIG